MNKSKTYTRHRAIEANVHTLSETAQLSHASPTATVPAILFSSRLLRCLAQSVSDVTAHARLCMHDGGRRVRLLVGRAALTDRCMSLFATLARMSCSSDYCSLIFRSVLLSQMIVRNQPLTVVHICTRTLATTALLGFGASYWVSRPLVLYQSRRRNHVHLRIVTKSSPQPSAATAKPISVPSR